MEKAYEFFFSGEKRRVEKRDSLGEKFGLKKENWEKKFFIQVSAKKKFQTISVCQFSLKIVSFFIFEIF